MNFLRRILFVAAATSLLAVSCKNPATLTGTSQTATRAAAFSQKVTVEFQGSVAHLFKSSVVTVPSRAVILKARTGDPVHFFKLFVPIAADKAVLDKATGIVSKPRTTGFYEVDGLSGVDMRVVGWDATTGKATALGPPLSGTAAGTTFEAMTPHLQKVTDNTMVDIASGAIEADAPDASDPDFAAYFELEGGTLSAIPFCEKSKFTQDYAKEGMRDFSDIVNLSGTVGQHAALQLRSKGETAWRTVPLGTADLTVGIENLPDLKLQSMSHFLMFMRLAGPKSTSLKRDDVETIVCSQKGPIPGCSNSQFP